MKSLLGGVAVGALASVLAFWLAQVAAGQGLPQSRSLVAISPVVAGVSAFFLMFLGFAVMGWRSARWPFVRRLLVVAVYALVPFGATVLLFREDGGTWSYLWSSWSAILESLPWYVAYSAGGIALLLASHPKAAGLARGEAMK